jgi:tetratricopeptide (TPR) repeat protein
MINEDEPLPIRIGLNTGPTLIAMDEDTGSYTASGATVSLASRLADNADGLVLITQDTFRHVQGVFGIQEDMPLRVRRAGGRAQVNTYRVNEAKPRAFRIKPRGVEGIDTRMIGRRAELEQIQKSYFNAFEDSETQVVTVVGPAGVGKSRLLYEFATWSELRPERYYIFRGRATPAMTTRPYGLWRDVLSFRFEILDSDSPEIVRQKMVEGITNLIGEDEKLAHLMGHLAGFDFSGSPYLGGDPQSLAEKGRKAVNEFFKRLSVLDPVLLQLEDLHHADESSLDLLAEWASADEGLPLLVVCVARPDLYQRRPTWGSGQDFHSRVDLRPLDKRDSRDLASEILQKVADLPRELRDLVVERAEGNPYYMEELVKMLIEDRVIQKLDEERWTVEISRLKQLRVPPTLVGLLQARFDSLLYPEKLTLQRAAVAGRVFYDSAVASMDAADETHVDELGPILKRLTEREFIFPRETSAFENSTEYIFGQAMMRDLILETLLERQKEVYHRSMAQWVAAQGGERAGEYDALIADHYEKASEYFLAAQYLEKAAGAAITLGAYQEGIRNMERGLSLLAKTDDSPEKTRLRMNMQMALANPLGFLGEYDQTRIILESALDSARELNDRQAEGNILAQLGRLIGAWQEDTVTGRAYLEEALAINKELDDKKGLVFILRQLGNVAHNEFKYEESLGYLNESLALAKELEDLGDIANALNSLGNAAGGLDKLDEALAYYKEALEISRQLDDSVFTAMMIGNMSPIYADREDYQAARQKAQEAMVAATEANSSYLLLGVWTVLGWSALGLGENELAGDYLIRALQLSQELDTDLGRAHALVLYAWYLVRSGEIDEALSWIEPSRAVMGPLPWFDRLINKVLADLPADMTDAQVKELMAKGAEVDISEVVSQILAANSEALAKVSPAG